MKLILFASLIFPSIVLINGQEKEALIFDRFNRSLFDLPNEIPKNAKCGAWAVACPAETSPEIDFVKQYSSTKNALFVRVIHDRGSKASEVRKNICKESFKLSMTYHIKSSSFRFGFELYYKLKDADYFHNENFDDFKTVEEVIANMFSIVKKTKYIAGEYKRITKNAAGVDIEELWFNNNRKMGFTWIELVKFGYETSKRILRNMAYNISTNSQWPVAWEKCEDYKLGNEIYKDIDVEKLYSKDTKKIFEGYKLPNTPGCGSNNECFVKSLIIPMDQFRFGSSTPPSCSNLATIPLWKITKAAESLKRVDQYLYSLYQVVGEPLRIIAGISGEHAYSKIRSWGKVPIYLDPERKKIPIPKIIYKIVEYRVKNCKLEEKQCWYSSIIVIHNDPFFKPTDKVCPSDITTNWGWQGIKGGDDSEIVYVCPRDKNVMNKLLGILGSDKYAESPDLKLTHFPRSKDGQKIDPKDISREVNSRYDKFLREGEDSSERGKKIMELAHIDHDNPDDKELLYSEGDAVRRVEGEREGDRAELGKEGTLTR